MDQSWFATIRLCLRRTLLLADHYSAWGSQYKLWFILYTLLQL